MRVLYQRCAAVGAGKDVVAVAARLSGKGPDGRVAVKRTYRALCGVPAEMSRWLASGGVTHVAVEAAGAYSVPACRALLGRGEFEQVLACSAAHVKNVPGRETGLAGAGWLAQLPGCGPLPGGFIPPADVEAVRDLVRYRVKGARRRVSGTARPGDVLRDAGIKIDSAASFIAAKPGRLMTGALTGGERRGQVPAGLAAGKMRSKVPDLPAALEGRPGEHRAMLRRLRLKHPEEMLGELDAPPATS